MKTARLVAPRTVEVADAPAPMPGGGQAIVRSETMGICGTDLKVVAGDVAVGLPRTLGHEMVGRVVSSAEPRLPEGTRVLVDPAIACGSCDPCRRRRPNLCLRGGLMGREVDGVLAELVAVDSSALVPVPEHVTDAEAGLLQVLGTCAHALADLDADAGETAVVVGLGVAGQLMVQLLAARGLTVVGLTRSEEKRALAARHGATVVAHPDDGADAVTEAGGKGPGLVVEAVGTEATLGHAIALARPGADVVAFGTITHGGKGLPYYQLYLKELTLHNPRAALREDYVAAVAAVAEHRIHVSEIVTHMFDLEEITDALDAASDPSSLKVLLTGPT